MSANTVAIYSMEGTVRAKVGIQPRQMPSIGNAAVMLQSPAVVSGSAVYYLDGYQRLWMLGADGKSKAVTTFSQHGKPYETWFAVKPDGSLIVAGIWTYDSNGAYFGLFTVSPGVAPTLTVNAAGPFPPDQIAPLPVGWTSAGPIAMQPSSLTTQNAWSGGPLELLTFPADGVHGTTIGGVDCRSASITAGGLIPCISSKEVVTVRDSTGKILWTTHAAGVNALTLYLSPDGQAISDGLQKTSDGGVTWWMEVESSSGKTVQLPRGFRVEGWLDNRTVIGAVTPPGGGDEGNLAWVSLDDPGTAHTLGFKGDFVGTLS